MSNCKEGEGLWHIAPAVFNNTVLEHGKRYTVILLADGDVVVKGYVTANITSIEDDWRLYLSENGLASLLLRMPYYSSHYVSGFDVIIRDDDKTLIMLPNVEYHRRG